VKISVVKLLLAVLWPILSSQGQQKLPYQQDFEKEEAGKIPSDFLVLDGAFAVKEENGNKFLELPGAPLDTFAVQFGPAEADNISVSASMCGTAKGRRFPVFGVGLNGVAGYRLQVSPAKNMVELFKDQALKASTSFDWKSGSWLSLRLQVRRGPEGIWKIEGKAWLKGSPEPPQWIISAEEKEPPQPGRASIFGSPFSGTPIQFDDFVVERPPG